MVGETGSDDRAAGNKEVPMNAQRTWFMTGSSRGFGRIWTEAALERGDRVVATARHPEVLEPLVERFGDRIYPLALDVTDREAVQRVVQEARDHFGSLDIVVNNAGYGVLGMMEELNEDDVRAQFETNVFGALWVTQAALPIMREQRRGHIVQIASIAGQTAVPQLGWYCASKWAMEGFSQSLALEVADFGIHVTMVEPTLYATDWEAPSAKLSSPVPAYDPVRERYELHKSFVPRDPVTTSEALFAIVDAPEPPLRCLMGAGMCEMLSAQLEDRIAGWRQWDAVAKLADGIREPALA